MGISTPIPSPTPNLAPASPIPWAIILIGIVVLAAAIVIAIILLRSSRRKRADFAAQAAYAQRQAVAAPASATVVEAHVVMHNPYQNRQVVHLQLSVTPPGGQAYFATSDWELDQAAMEYLKPGSQVAVRIDTQDPNIVYPNIGWARYYISG
jgi:hypothetical protein